MLTAGRLFSLGVGSARRQGWAFVPLYVAVVLGRLLGLMPSLTLAARFVRSGLRQGAEDPISAYVLGFLAGLDELEQWIPAWLAGSAVALFGAWVLSVVVQAGVIRLLAAQASTTEEASDEAFAEGVLRAPATYLVTAALAEALKFLMVGCSLGALLAAMSAFTSNPGMLGALLMTLATATILALPLIIAALDVGFARSVILDEAPSVALAEGLLLSWRRASTLLPPWYILKLIGVGATFSGGVALMTVNALPSTDGLWILRYGPMSMVSLALLAAMTALTMAQLGMNAALVAESAGTVPLPPVFPEPVLVAVAIEEPVLVAQEVPPASDQGT
jgi:hypothetical protein